MDLGISGRTALVMGASRGIGLGSRRPWRAREREWGSRAVHVKRLAEAVDRVDGDVVPFEADTSDLERLAALPGEVGEAIGQVEVLVANTGGPPLGGSMDNPREEWEQAYRSLVLAPEVLVEAVLPGMRERGWGRIVNVSSTSVANRSRT